MRNERVDVPIVVNTVSKATVSVENASTCDGFVVKSSSMPARQACTCQDTQQNKAKVVAFIVL